MALLILQPRLKNVIYCGRFGLTLIENTLSYLCKTALTKSSTERELQKDFPLLGNEGTQRHTE